MGSIYSCVAYNHARRVLRAVQRHASTRWYALGREIGFSSDQLEIYGGKFAHDTDKLHAIFDQVQKDYGDKAVDMLLDACHTIDLPVDGLVKEVLQDYKADGTVCNRK